MDDYEVGAATESRFLRLMSAKVDSTPLWYRYAEKASYEWDHRGIDFFVYISHKEGGSPVKVPVQIKSSKERAREFRCKRSAHQVSHIVIFVVTRRMSDMDVLNMVYARLRRVHASGARYDRYYAREIQIAESHGKSRA